MNYLYIYLCIYMIVDLQLIEVPFYERENDFIGAYMYVCIYIWDVYVEARNEGRRYDWSRCRYRWLLGKSTIFSVRVREARPKEKARRAGY